MDFVELTASAYPYLDVFDYDHYSADFTEFERRCADWFAEYSASEERDTVESILEKFERRWEELPRRERKEAQLRDKQVLALFFSPAAERASDTEKAFSDALREQWNTRFPKNTYLPGHFEAIRRAGLEVSAFQTSCCLLY